MIKISIPAKAIKKDHEVEALKHALKRGYWKSSLDEMNLDWYKGGFHVRKNLSELIVNKISSSNEHEVELSSDVVPYIEDLSVGNYKGVLAWLIWNEYSNGLVNDNKKRIEADWLTACTFINNFLRNSLNRVSDLKISFDSSILNYIENNYQKNKTTTINKKAFWHHMAYPLENPVTNYILADNFVNDFYRLAKEIMSGNTTNALEMENLILNQCDIANMLELIIFRLKRFVKPEATIH